MAVLKILRRQRTQPKVRRRATESRSEFVMGLQQVLHNRLATVGLAMIAVMLFLALFGSLLPLTDPLVQNMDERVQPPSVSHPLGTDNLGRDVLSRLVWGTRVSVLVGVGAVFLAIAIGIPLGLAAGYTGGWLEAVIMRLLDAVLSFPMMILAIALVARLGSGFGNVILAIGLVTTPVFGRLAHASTLSAKQEEYVTGARAIGATDTRIMFRHILPSTFAPITVQAGANFAMALIAEATLSFLGMGTKAPDPSWGMMLNDARGYITDAPWLVFFPAAWISVAVLAVNFFADGLRDALDPHYRVE